MYAFRELTQFNLLPQTLETTPNEISEKGSKTKNSKTKNLL